MKIRSVGQATEREGNKVKVRKGKLVPPSTGLDRP